MVTGPQQSFLPAQYPNNGFQYGGVFPNAFQSAAPPTVRRGAPTQEYRAPDAPSITYPQLLPSLLDSSSGPLLGLKLKKSPSALDWFQQQLDQQQRGQQPQQLPVLQQQQQPAQLPAHSPVLPAPPTVSSVPGVLQSAATLPTLEPHTSYQSNNQSMGTSFEETLAGMDLASSSTSNHFLEDSIGSPEADDWTAMMTEPLCDDDLAVVQHAAVIRRSASLGHDPRLPPQGGVSKYARTSPFGTAVSTGGAPHRRSFS